MTVRTKQQWLADLDPTRWPDLPPQAHEALEDARRRIEAIDAEWIEAVESEPETRGPLASTSLSYRAARVS